MHDLIITELTKATFYIAYFIERAWRNKSKMSDCLRIVFLNFDTVLICTVNIILTMFFMSIEVTKYW